MPRYDLACANGHESELCAKWQAAPYPCPTCGAPTVKLWKASAMVNRDEIPGGFIDENLGPEPVRYDTWSERRRLMKERGLVERVQHVGVDGTDKSPHTQRWDICPAALLISEADRIAALRRFDEVNGIVAVERPVTLIAPEEAAALTEDQQRAIGRVASAVGL